MNRIYRLVWNRALRVLQVASEFAQSHGGEASSAGASTPRRRRPLAQACAIALALGAALYAATPQAAAQSVVGGQGGQGAGAGAGAGGASGNGGGSFFGGGAGSNQGKGGSGYGGALGGAVGGTYSSAAMPSSNLTGGNGNGGGTAYAIGYGGGGGGAGAYLSGAATLFTINSGIIVQGGNGGAGGSLTAGGGGGGGGNGITVAAGSGFTIKNNGGNISGGNGGAGGGSTGGGGGGGGGNGIAGADITVNDFSGTISGGRGGAGGSGSPGEGGGGGSNGDAILFTGGTNTLVYGGGAINGAVEVTSGATATITADAGGLDLSGGTLGSSALIVGGTTSIDTNQHTFNVSGTISGDGTLIQLGGGSLILTGANTYSGGLQINAGEVDAGNANALGTGTVAMAAGTTLGFTANGLTLANAFTLSGDPTYNVPTGDTETVSGVIADGTTPGTLEKTGGGSLELTGANTYSGGTTLGGGTLVAGTGTLSSGTPVTATPFGTGMLTMDAGTTLSFDADTFFNDVLPNDISTAGAVTITAPDYGTPTLSGNITGSSTGVVSLVASSEMTLSGNNTFNGGLEVASGYVLLTGNNTGNITIDAPSQNGFATLQVGNGGATNAGTISGNVVDNGQLIFANTATGQPVVTFAGDISGSGGVEMSGTGTLSLTGTNTYDGSSLGSNVAATQVNSGRLDATPGALGSGAVSVAGGGSISNGQASGNGATLSIVGTGSFTNDVTNAGSSDVAISVPMFGTSLTFYEGTPFGGTSTFGQGVTLGGASQKLTNGLVADASGIALPGQIPPGSIQNLTINIQNAAITGGTATFSGNADAGSASIENGIAMSGTFSGLTGLTSDTINITSDTLSGGSLTFADTATADAASIHNGTSIAGTLSGIGSASGDLNSITNSTLQGGTLGFGTGTSAGSASIDNSLDVSGLTGGLGSANSNGGTISGDKVLGGNITFSGTASAGTASIDNSANLGTFIDGLNADTVDVSNNTLGGGNITFTDTSSAGHATFNNGLSTTDAGVSLITNSRITGNTVRGGIITFADSSDAGSAVIDNGVTYTGSMLADGHGNTMQGGAVYFDANSTATGATVNDGIAGTLDISGHVGTLTLGAVSGGADSSIVLGNNILETGSLGQSTTFAGVVTDGGGTTGGLIKTGTGTLTLDGVNTYGGLTEVQGGTLLVGDASNPTASISGSAQVDNGGTLGGHGSIGGNVDVLSGGIVAPGGSIGTLTVGGNFTAAQGSVLDYELGAPGANAQTAGTGDRVIVGGNLTLNGATLNVADAGGMGPGLYNLFSFSGTLTETSGGLTLGTTPAGQSLTLQALAHQINLIDASNVTLAVWNANGQASTTQMGGGSGTWSTTSANWTDAAGTAPNGAMNPQPGFAVFGGTAGTVMVDDSAGAVQATGMQFATSGYTLTGGTLTLVGSGGAAPVIRVGDGSADGASMTATIASVLAGSAGLDKTDSGTLVLTGVNTYTGATTISGGTLTLSGSGSIAASSGVTDSGTLDISGTANGASIASLAGSGTVSLGSQTLTLSSASGSFAGAIGGTGGLTLANGTETLTGASSYTGVTTISAGTLALSGSGGLADSSGITDDGTFDISGTTGGASVSTLGGNGIVTLGSQTLTLSKASGSFGGVIGGNGGLTLTKGTETLAGDNTYVGATIITAGTLALSGSGSLAQSSGVTDDGTFDISGTTRGTSVATLGGNGAVLLGSQTLTLSKADGSFSGVIGGSGGLTLASGTEMLTGTNTYTGATTINAGTLTLSGSGSLAGTSGITNNGTLTFDLSGNSTFANVVSGNGTLVQDSSGTLTLTGANSYTGTTTIRAGTLVASSASLPGNVADNAALVFDQASDGTFAGAISGNGSLAKSGTGTLILDGNSSAFAGATTVSAGTLEVGDASTPSTVLGGNVTVDAGAMLRGHGTVGGSVINDGTVWAGGSIGTLTIAGNYTQRANGVLEAEIASTGQTSLLAIDGTASLGGSTLVLADDTGSLTPGSVYTLLTARGGLSGTFASLTSNFAFLDPQVVYGADAVELSLQRNGVAFPDVGQTPNERAAAAGAQSLGAGNPFYDAILTLNVPTARHAFDQLSGEIHASTRTAIADDDHYVRDAINQHLAGQSNDADGLNVTDADGVTAWTATWGHWGNHDGDGNASTLDDNGSGLLFGVDLPVGGSARLGAVLGTGEGTTDIDALGSSAHTLDQHLGLYGSAQTGALLWQGAAIYGWQKVDTHRSIDFGTFDGTADSSYRAHTAQAYVDGSLPFALGGTTLAPFANLAAERLSTPAVRENGSPAALDVAAQDSTVGYGTLGLRATFDLGAPNHGLHAHASLGWQHAWGDVLPVDAMRFESGGDAFAIAGTQVLRNAGVASVGISFTVAPNVSVDGTYQGQFGKQASDQAGRISLDWKF